MLLQHAVVSMQKMFRFRPEFCRGDPSRTVSCNINFALSAKSDTAENTNFALNGYNRFMRPSWVRAHGLIFGKVYIVWVCALPYSPLSSPRSRIRENSALKSGPNFLTHSGGIFYPVVFPNSVHPVAERQPRNSGERGQAMAKRWGVRSW